MSVQFLSRFKELLIRCATEMAPQTFEVMGFRSAAEYLDSLVPGDGAAAASGRLAAAGVPAIEDGGMVAAVGDESVPDDAATGLAEVTLLVCPGPRKENGNCAPGKCGKGKCPGPRAQGALGKEQGSVNLAASLLAHGPRSRWSRSLAAHQTSPTETQLHLLVARIPCSLLCLMRRIPLNILIPYS